MTDQKRDIVFGYFSVPTEFRKGKRQRYGRVCVALKRPPKGSGSTIFQAAFSFCSPKDNFDKRLARMRTTEQLEGQAHKVITFSSESNGLNDVFVEALSLSTRVKNTAAFRYIPYADSMIAPRWIMNANPNAYIIFGSRSKFSSSIMVSEILYPSNIKAREIYRS